MQFCNVDENRYFICDAPFATGDEPNVVPHEAPDGTKPDGMRKARYVADSWVDEEAASLAADIAAQDAERLVTEGKQQGFLYSGVPVPVTNADAIGALQIAYGFEQMGMQSTNFALSNGDILPITLAEWPTFKAQFFAARASFFQ